LGPINLSCAALSNSDMRLLNGLYTANYLHYTTIDPSIHSVSSTIHQGFPAEGLFFYTCVFLEHFFFRALKAFTVKS